MKVLITLTSAGTDTGPFDLYSNYDNYVIPIDTSVSREDLLAGYLCTTVPSGATFVRVQSISLMCSNYVDIGIAFPTTTTTSTSTTSTSTSTTSTTSTSTTSTSTTSTTTTSTTTAAPGSSTTTSTTTEAPPPGPTTTTTSTTTAAPGPPASTTTTTSTTAQPVYNPLLAYSAVDGPTACSNFNSFTNMAIYDTHCDPITTGCYLYTQGNIGNPAYYATDGWYSNGTNYWYFQNGSTGDAGTACGGISTTTTTSTSSTTTSTTTANPLCDLGNIVITAFDGNYGPYSYTTCGGTPVSQPGGSGTVGQILESSVCVLSGTFSSTGGTVQLNPTGSCS